MPITRSLNPRELWDDPTAGLAIKYRTLPNELRVRLTYAEFLDIAKILGHNTGGHDDATKSTTSHKPRSR